MNLTFKSILLSILFHLLSSSACYSLDAIHNFHHVAGSLYKTAFYDDDNIFISGERGMLLKSSDGGDTWKHIEINTQSVITDISIKNGIIVLITYAGELISSKDIGETWVYKNSLKKYKPISIFQDEDTWIVGAINQVLISNNQGDSWEEFTVNAGLISHIFKNESLFILADADGRIIISKDNGKNWFEDFDLNNLCMSCAIQKINIDSEGIIRILKGNYLFSYNNENEKWNVRTLTQAYKEYWISDGVFYGSKYDNDDFIATFKDNIESITPEKISEVYKPYNIFDIAIWGINKYKSTVIATGKDKTIFISKNSGLNWKMISFLDAGLFDQKFQFIKLINNKLCVGAGRSNLYVSNDQGATWLPQKNHTLDSKRDLNAIAIDSLGNGFIYSYTGTGASGLISVENFGDSTKYTKTQQMYPGLNDCIFMKVQNRYYLERQSLDDKTYLLCLDDSSKIVKIIGLDSILVVSLKITDSLNMEGWGNDYKGIQIDKDDSYLFHLTPIHFKTSDGGLTWVKEKLDNEYNSNNLLKVIQTSKDTMYLILTKQYHHQDIEWDILIKRSIDNGRTWTQIFQKDTFGYMPIVYEYNNDLYGFQFTSQVKLNKTTNTFEKVTDFSDDLMLLGSSKRKFESDNQYKKYAILLASKNKNPSILLSNSLDIISSVETNEIIEETRPLLYSSAPYPIPAQNYVKSTIYWNSVYDINQANFSVSDVFGNTIPYHKISIEQTDTYKGILNWDCTGISTGVYFIRVQLGSETITVPVAVGK